MTYDLDALGLLCPLPVLKARKRLKSLNTGDILTVHTDDPAAIIDMPHFCTEAGHTYHGLIQESPHQVHKIEKGQP